MVMSLSSGGSYLGGTHTEEGHARPRDHSTSGLRLSCRPWETIPKHGQDLLYLSGDLNRLT